MANQSMNNLHNGITSNMKFVGKNLPGPWAAKIGEKASEKSRSYTSNVKTISEEESLATLRQHVKRCMQKQDFDFLISGHIHVKEDHCEEIKGKKVRSINLGTWLKEPWAFKIDHSGGEFIPIK